MTDRRPGPDIDLSRLASEVLAEAIDGARRDAVAELRARIAGWLVESAEGSLPAAGAAASQESGAGTGTPTRPAEPPVEGSVDERPRAERAAAAGPDGGRRGWYVYGLTWEHVAGLLPPLDGVSGKPVEIVPVGRLAMVGSWIEQDQGSWGIDDSGDADLARLTPLVRAHERVLEALLDHGPVLPLRFGRLYPDPDRLRELVDRREEAVAATLERLEGRAEWGLTLEWDPEGTGRIRPVPGDGTEGSGYLAQRRDQMAAAAHAGAAARAQAGLVHESLAGIADDHVVHRLRRQSGGPRPVIWRASYLVADRRAEQFRQVASDSLSEAPAELGMSGQLTGPWPPYNFAGLDLEQLPA